MTATPPPPGPLATEAALLLDVLAARLSAVQPTVRPAPTDGPPATGEHGPDGSVCTTGCPFCQVLAVVRGERPETAARIVDGALVVVRGLRSLLDHTPHGNAPEHPRTAHDPAQPPPPPTTSGAASESPADDTPPGARTDSTGSTAARARVEWIDIR